MSEYVSPLGNELISVRLVRGVAFLLAGLAMFDLAADQLAKAFASFVVGSVEEGVEHAA